MARASRGVPPRALAGRPAPPYVVQLPVPAFAVSRTLITGLIQQLPNALNFKHTPVAASTHDFRLIRAGRVRCGAQRQESGADEVPGDAREGARRGMGRCRAGPCGERRTTPSETQGNGLSGAADKMPAETSGRDACADVGGASAERRLLTRL